METRPSSKSKETAAIITVLRQAHREMTGNEILSASQIPAMVVMSALSEMVGDGTLTYRMENGVQLFRLSSKRSNRRPAQ